MRNALLDFALFTTLRLILVSNVSHVSRANLLQARRDGNHSRWNRAASFSPM